MRLFRVLLAAVAASAVVVAGAAPALAHDELIGSSPVAGERLDSAPEQVELRLSGDVLTIGAAVIVVDASGRDWVTTEPEVVSGSVIAHLDAGMPEAGYEIRWRVVSEDGHPISGLIPFTVGDGEPFERAPASGDAADATETDAGDTSSENTAESARPRTVLIGAGGAIVAAGAFLLVTIFRRRSRVDADAAS